MLYRGRVEHGELTGAVLDGRYRVIEPVAEGAMGVVYRAERVKLGRIVAIKVLHDVLPGELSARKRFEIEAMAMAKLEHPHCASVLDVGTYDDRPYVVMDFVSGKNLKDLVSEGPQPAARAVELVRQVLSGLAHAHELGIIHRDIKPANIVLSQKVGLGDHVKILDFGLARLHDTGQNLTTGIVVGTPAYMAPEQIRGVVLDHRVDIYACGILLFELLTGHKPFHSENDDPIEVCKMHLSSPVPRLVDLRPGVDFGALEAVAAKALSKDADDRYDDAQAFVAALDAAQPRRPSLPSLPATPAPVATLAPGEAGPGELTAALDRLTDLPSRGRTVAGVGPEKRTATPVAGVPQSRGGTGLAEAWQEPQSPPGTFLGIVVTPKPGSLRAETVQRRLAEAKEAKELEVKEPEGREPEGKEPTPTPAPVERASISTFEGHSPDDVLVGTPPAARSSGSPLSRWLWQRRKIVVPAGVGLIGVLVVIALAAGHGDPPLAPAPAPVAAPVAPPPPASDPAADLLAHANDLLAQGNRDGALDVLARGHRQFPDHAEIAYAAGKLYFARYYWTDGLKSFRDALRIDPRYRTDPELIKTVLRGFLLTPGYNDDIASFLREDIGDAARSYLEETARDHPSADLRKRAAAELRRYH